jgi:hypothetical protein
LANFLKTLARHARNFPKNYLPDSLLSSPSAWINNKGWPDRPRFDRRTEMDSTSSFDSKSSDHKREEKVEKSYLTAAVESISPWGSSLSSTLKPKTNSPSSEASGLKNQHGGDHSTSHWRGLSAKRYPADCPRLKARWFYAVDVSTGYIHTYYWGNERMKG